MGYLYIFLVSAILGLQDCLTEYTNVAFYKSVTLSSYYGDEALGSKAVDGQKVGDWKVDGCACTLQEQNPWLLLDLGSQYAISSIFILNRIDSSTHRLSNVHVEIGLSEDNLTEIAYHNDPVGHNITFTLNTTLCGRYVRIWLEKLKEYLTICELEVFGTESDGGNWTSWSDWSWCSHSCGNGTSTRSRSCTGENCCGATAEIISCNTYACPDTSSDGFCQYEPRDCQDIFTSWSGVFHVTPLGIYNGFDVFCDMQTDGGGWLVSETQFLFHASLYAAANILTNPRTTPPNENAVIQQHLLSDVEVFQRREDESVDFNRNWYAYLNGFGEVTGNYWLGLRLLKSIVAQGHYELRVDLEDVTGNKIFAKYEVFSLGEHVDQYPLIVDGYSGTAGDAFSTSKMSPFSTKDRDLTNSTCPARYESAWWFSACIGPYLNGRYATGHQETNNSSIHWVSSEGNTYSVSKATMKIRRI